jgi:hypothetical protein
MGVITIFFFFFFLLLLLFFLFLSSRIMQLNACTLLKNAFLAFS